MRFLGVDRVNIKNTSSYVDDMNCYTLGNPVEITCMKKNHKNDIIANNLSSNMSEDMLMLKYTPTNKIYFTDEFLEAKNEGNSASILIDVKSGRVCVGSVDEFKSESGTLIFSGALSFNNLVDYDYRILGAPKMSKNVREHVHILAIGVRGDKLLALMYIPKTRGVAIDINNNVKECYSSNTGQLRDCTGWEGITVKSWFDGVRIREVNNA